MNNHSQDAPRIPFVRRACLDCSEQETVAAELRFLRYLDVALTVYEDSPPSHDTANHQGV